MPKSRRRISRCCAAALWSLQFEDALRSAQSVVIVIVVLTLVV
jgi:hypothetical protein